MVHEDTKTGGIAGEIAAILCEKAFGDLDGPVLRVTALDTPVPYSPPLEEYFLPNTQKDFDCRQGTGAVLRIRSSDRSRFEIAARISGDPTWPLTS